MELEVQGDHLEGGEALGGLVLTAGHGAGDGRGRRRHPALAKSFLEFFTNN